MTKDLLYRVKQLISDAKNPKNDGWVKQIHEDKLKEIKKVIDDYFK